MTSAKDTLPAGYHQLMDRIFEAATDLRIASERPAPPDDLARLQRTLDDLLTQRRHLLGRQALESFPDTSP